MERSELTKLITEATQSAFRLECLPQYLVPQEDAAFTAWKTGTPLPARTPQTSPWLATIQERTRAGCLWHRVHILDYPLSAYTQFELNAYQANQAAGEKIYLADRADHAEFRDMKEDFWLLDDTLAIKMIYDSDGRFIRPERVQHIEPYLELRDIALQYSEPLYDYMNKREPQLLNSRSRQ